MTTTSAPNGTVVLACSGGLDTSALVPWLKEKHGYDVDDSDSAFSGAEVATLRELLSLPWVRSADPASREARRKT